jgi:hypothetical protein
MKRQQVSAEEKTGLNRAVREPPTARMSRVEILRLFQSRVDGLADPATALDALKEILKEVRKGTRQQGCAEHLFFEVLNFYDGLLQGFDWGWRAARWKRPKGIEDLDRFVITMLMKQNKKLTNEEICIRVDRKALYDEAKLEGLKLKGQLTQVEIEQNRLRVRLTDKLKGQNIQRMRSVLGKDPVHWTWKKAIRKDTKIHAVEVTLSDLRNEASLYGDALWWHHAVSRYYRKHGRIDWARRSAALKLAARP